jgi:hypothetical protein
MIPQGTPLPTVEEDLRNACGLALKHLTIGSATKAEYEDLLNVLRLAVGRSDNKSFHCSTGVHSSNCTCAGDQVGYSPYYKKGKKR